MSPDVDEKLVEVMIKNAQIEEKYVALHTRFDKFEENITLKLDSVCELGKTCQDHEARIKSLEETKVEIKEDIKELKFYQTPTFKSGMTAGGISSAVVIIVAVISKLFGV